VKLATVNADLHQLTETEVSWIASIHEIGRLSSPIVSPFIVDNIGRRYSVALVSALIVLIWVSLTFVRDAYLICALRFAFGATNGLQDVVAPIYTTENCSDKCRPIVAGLMFIVLAIGRCLELIIATNSSYGTTAIANTLISICGFGALYFCVETPPFLIMKGKYALAKTNLEWLQVDLKPDELSGKLEKLKYYVHKEKAKKKSIRTLLSCAENVKSVCIVFGMYLASTATGGAALGTYASVVFASTRPVTWSHFLFVAEIASFPTLLMSQYINAKIRPQKVLMVCYSVLALSKFLVGVLFYLHGQNHEIKFYPWLVFVTVLSCSVLRTVASPAMYVVRGEILPLSIRATGGSVAVITQAGCGFCILKAFLFLSEHFGIEVNFLFYSLMALTTSVLAYYCLPSETKNESRGDLKTDEAESEVV
jgi:MFS family permease